MRLTHMTGVWLVVVAGCGGFEPVSSPSSVNRSVPQKVATIAVADAGDSKQATGMHALLIGTSKYPSLPDAYQLEGPANDVVLMRKLLTSSFGFPDANIVTLAEKNGKALPTRGNIASEFRRLARIARPNDQVVIFMAGHGSQQPEAKDSKDPEPDGLDEFYLPRDIGTWNGDVGGVPNAILDNDLRIWLDAIRDTKASVWLIVDTCHSGTMLRAAGERVRKVDAESVLKIPAIAVQKARSRAAKSKTDNTTEKTRGGPIAGDARTTLASGGGIVALYACLPSEVTVERRFSGAETNYHGLLTHTLSKVLARAHEANPPTYRELLQRLHTEYANMGRTSPTPVLEGSPAERDREVLGNKVWIGRSRITITRPGSEWKVNAGSLHGLTPGSILAVFPPTTGKEKDPVGHVRVVRLRALTSIVEPCKHDGKKSTDELPNEGRCEVVEVQLGDNSIQVAVDPLDDAGKPIPAGERNSIAEELKTLASGKRSLLAYTPQPEDADWLVRWHANKLHLVRGSEWSKRGKQSGGKLFGPFAGPKRMADLEDSLFRIARAEMVKKLLSSSQSSIARRGSIFSQVRVEAEVVRLRDENDAKGETLRFGSDGMTLFNEDLVTLRVKNLSRFDVDLTVLYIDSGYGIHAWFPVEEFNRFKAGEVQLLPPISITTDTTGTEFVAIMAVKATTPQPIDFTFLEQPTIERVRGLGSKSPLGKLMQSEVYREGKTRSFGRAVVESYNLQLMPWRIMSIRRNDSKQNE